MQFSEAMNPGTLMQNPNAQPSISTTILLFRGAPPPPLVYHPELDATMVVEVNSDISSGDCPEEVPTMTDGPQDVPCAPPADRIFRALAEALGKPAPAPSQ
jgi:hypothetical protein